MTLLYFVLLLLAAVCFFLAVTGRITRWNLIALGLLLWVLVPLIQTGKAL